MKKQETVPTAPTTVESPKEPKQLTVRTKLRAGNWPFLPKQTHGGFRD